MNLDGLAELLSTVVQQEAPRLERLVASARELQGKPISWTISHSWKSSFFKAGDRFGVMEGRLGCTHCHASRFSLPSLFAHRRCRCPTGAGQVRCACGWKRELQAADWDQDHPRNCLACGNADLWRQKDFPQRLGLIIIAVQVVLTTAFWSWHRPHLDLCHADPVCCPRHGAVCGAAGCPRVLPLPRPAPHGGRG